MNYKKIEKELYTIANKIVCNIGQETKSSISVTGEKYITFKFRFYKNIGQKKIINEWQKWIKVYCVFANYNKPETFKSNLIGRNALTIYWRILPCFKENPENDNEMMLRARLLISTYNRKEV